MKFFRLTNQTVVGHPGWLVGESQDTARPLTADELVDHGFLALIDEPPVLVNPLRDVVRQNPIAEWVIDDTSARVTYTVEARDVEDVRAELKAAVDRRTAEALDAGYPIPGAGGLRSSLTDTARTDLNGLASIAMLVMSGTLPAWPFEAQGWITLQNVRHPLPTPQAAIALAAGVAGAYGSIRQHARTLKDQLAAAADVDALLAVDIEAGWPV